MTSWQPEINERPRDLTKTFYSTFWTGLWTSLWTLGRSRWIWWNVCGVRIIVRVIGWRPEAREPDVREGDLVGVVRIREGFRSIVSGWSEMKSESDITEIHVRCGGNRMQDETVNGLSHVLHRFDGCEHVGVNVERTVPFGDGGNEPIQVDPEQIPDHGINPERKPLPRTRPWLMHGVSDTAASQIGDGVSGHFDERGSLQFGRSDPDGIVIRIVQGFIGSQFLLDAIGTVTGFLSAYDAAVSALETGLAGFVVTAFVEEFPATGHDVTSLDGLNV